MIRHVWTALQPIASAILVDTGHFAMLIAMLAATHVVIWLGRMAGVDKEMLDNVALIEKWVSFAIIIAYFLKVLLRAAAELREDMTNFWSGRGEL